MASTQEHSFVVPEGWARQLGKARSGGGVSAVLGGVRRWWRMLGLSQACPYTAAVLNRAGRFRPVARGFVAGRAAERLAEEAMQFLDHVARDRDALIAAVAATEAALLRARRDPAMPERRIRWPQDPDPVFAYIERGEPFHDEAGSPFTVAVGPMHPGGLTCWRS
ncbi:MAG: hypothetical protein JO209_09295 [Acidisphaera sp.]|nr:hypothetical protein [Acidisphaera sp.]